MTPERIRQAINEYDGQYEAAADFLGVTLAELLAAIERHREAGCYFPQRATTLVFMPTLDDIKAAAREIRRGWTKQDYQRRRMLSSGPVEIRRVENPLGRGDGFMVETW